MIITFLLTYIFVSRAAECREGVALQNVSNNIFYNISRDFLICFSSFQFLKNASIISEFLLQ